METVLIVDDNEATLSSMACCLREWGYGVMTAHSGPEALDVIPVSCPDLVLLDIIMPGMSGLEVLEKVVQSYPDLPVIMVSVDDDANHVVQAIRLGTWDYIMKPITDVSVLKNAVESCLSRARLKKENREHRLKLEQTVVSQSEEISRMYRTLKTQSQVDDLTGLPNRQAFLDRLTAVISECESGDMAALFILDVDDFSYVNGNYGHYVGNQVLVQIARLMSHMESSGCYVGRVGSDEFGILVSSLKNRALIYNLAEELGELFSKPMVIGDRRVDMAVSCGVAIYPDDAKDGDEIFTNAGIALQAAKAAGKGCFRLFSQTFSSESSRYFKRGTYMREALDRGEFEVYYQPMIRSCDGALCGMEALLRWHSSRLGRMVVPDEFIPAAEELGMVVPLGDWVLRAACTKTMEWIKEFGNLRLAVNLSARQFMDPALVSRVVEAISDTGFPPECLELELTENILLKSEERAVDVMYRLVDMGIGMAIDDFGTGYSSMTYLKRFPVRRLKVDRSFVSGIPGDKDDMAITEAIVNLGHSLGKELVAEGVETMEQQKILASMKCDVLQGFLFSPPIPGGSFEQYLRNKLGEQA